MTEPTAETPRPSTPHGRRLLDELSESPLPGARYAHDVVSRRLAAIEDWAFAAGRAAALDFEELATALFEVRWWERCSDDGAGFTTGELARELRAALAHPAEAEEKPEEEGS